MLSESAATAAEALDLLRRKTFDIALIDFELPEMDGILLAREMRKTTQIPLMLLSSSGESVSGEDANLFQAQLSKPLKHSLLFAAILRLTGTKNDVPVPVQKKHFDHQLAAVRPLRILLAEDNSINQKVALKMLAQFGYGADLADNGREALEVGLSADYDLILMDIQMPGMDGMEASQNLRMQLGERCPYIVALTAEALEGDRQRFLAGGFDGYLSKPLQVTALEELLRSAPTLS